MAGKLPDSLPEAEKNEAKRVMLAIGSTIIFKKKFHFTSYAGPTNGNRSCVEASIDRGNWLLKNLPPNWWVDVYTWKSMLHTSNLAYFQGTDGLSHCWIVDGYGYPVTENAVVYLTSQSEKPGDSLLGGEYARTMASFPGIRGVFPAQGRGAGRF